MKMDALSQFTEWFPDIMTPVLAQRDEAEAKYQESEARFQESEAGRIAERRNFRQRIYRKFQKKYQCEILDSLKEKLEQIDDIDSLANIYESLWDTDDLERFELVVENQLTQSK